MNLKQHVKSSNAVALMIAILVKSLLLTKARKIRIVVTAITPSCRHLRLKLKLIKRTLNHLNKRKLTCKFNSSKKSRKILKTCEN